MLRLSDTIGPLKTDEGDIYPTHDAIYGKGGRREVANVTDILDPNSVDNDGNYKNKFPKALLDDGCICYVQNEDVEYVYHGKKGFPDYDTWSKSKLQLLYDKVFNIPGVVTGGTKYYDHWIGEGGRMNAVFNIENFKKITSIKATKITEATKNEENLPLNNIDLNSIGTSISIPIQIEKGDYTIELTINGINASRSKESKTGTYKFLDSHKWYISYYDKDDIDHVKNNLNTIFNGNKPGEVNGYVRATQSLSTQIPDNKTIYVLFPNNYSSVKVINKLNMTLTSDNPISDVLYEMNSSYKLYTHGLSENSAGELIYQLV